MQTDFIHRLSSYFNSFFNSTFYGMYKNWYQHPWKIKWRISSQMIPLQLAHDWFNKPSLSRFQKLTTRIKKRAHSFCFPN